MKLEAGRFYLNQMGEIRKIVKEDDKVSTLYRFWDSDRSYTEDGKYTQMEDVYDLLIEIPKDKLYKFIESIVKSL